MESPMSVLAQYASDWLGVELTQSQLEAFQRHSALLREWNERVNLTAITEPEAIEIRHFADSLSCLKVIKRRQGLKLIDVGTGAGFPGLPLKIACPEIDVTLLEATGKKVAFLDHVIDEFGLEGVRTVNARAEEAGQMADHREQYDWAVARAVARMPVLAEYLLPFVKVGGRCLAQKGDSAENEAQEATHSLGVLGGKLTDITYIELPSLDEPHFLVEIEKISPTPTIYPRRPGIPNKKPL
jgi:16S rRNA (guanine527-N7)-methyltransferase